MQMKHTIRPNQERVCQHQESKISPKLPLGPQLPSPLMLRRNRESTQEMGNVLVLQVCSLRCLPRKGILLRWELGPLEHRWLLPAPVFPGLLPSPAAGRVLYLLLAAIPMGPSYPCHVDPQLGFHRRVSLLKLR